MITASAPGKAVLSGEYVVLQDAPAIATAVDRRARVSLAETSNEYHSISAPGYVDGNWSFRMNEAGEFAWQDPSASSSTFALVEEVWKSFGSAQGSSLALTVDTRELRDTESGLKLGLGSSAAVAVALTAALQTYCAANGDIGATAMAAHERYQGGRGSGVDVATSLHGGLVLYRRAAAGVQRLDWPAGLHCRYLWSGRSAATAQQLGKLGRNTGRDAASASMNRLSDHADKVAAAWSLGDSRQILDSLPAYVEALRQFSVDHRLGIFDAGHENLALRASDDGIVYKPCGAGGGDIGIVFAASELAIDEFCEQARRQDFRILDVALDDQGVLVAG